MIDILKAVVATFVLTMLVYLFYEEVYQPAPTAADRVELNYLNNTLADIDDASVANARIRQLECDDFQKRAARYLKIPASGIASKVERYITYCRSVR